MTIPEALVSWANSMYARFGHPVYLVGSSLTEDEPNDIDVRIVLPHEEYVGRYGGTWTDRHRAFGEWPDHAKRWAAEMAKQARWVQRNVGLVIDFQVQSDVEVACYRHRDKPRIRIDTIDDTLPTEAGEGAGGMDTPNDVGE